MLKAYSIKFDGAILNRGFWLYVIDIQAASERCLYVGRTGDSSSANAASPFSRIGQHLDFRSHAKGNALTRNLRTAGLDPAHCRFEMIAIGPVFPEETDFALHSPIRDRVGALEKGLAVSLRTKGYRVLGEHKSRVSADPEQLAALVDLVASRLLAIVTENGGGLVGAGATPRS